MANERTLKLKIRELEKLLGQRKQTGDLLARMANEALRLVPSAAQRELIARWQKGTGPVAAEVKLQLQHEIGRLSSLTESRALLNRAAALLSVVPLGSSAAVDELLTEIGAFTGMPAARSVDATAALEHGQHRCDPEACPICAAFPNAKRRRIAERDWRPRAVETRTAGEALAEDGMVVVKHEPAQLKSGPLLEQLRAAGGEVHEFASPAAIADQTYTCDSAGREASGCDDPNARCEACPSQQRPEVTLAELDADAATLPPESLAANNHAREILGVPQVVGYLFCTRCRLEAASDDPMGTLFCSCLGEAAGPCSTCHGDVRSTQPQRNLEEQFAKAEAAALDPEGELADAAKASGWICPVDGCGARESDGPIPGCIASASRPCETCANGHGCACESRQDESEYSS